MYSPLHYALLAILEEEKDHVDPECMDILQYLLDNGADINRTDTVC